MERNTHQKKVVGDVLHSLRGMHPSADDVYDGVKEKIPSVSRATVYRILNAMADQGQVWRIHVPEAADIYDQRVDAHYHMRCGRCGRVLDVNMPVIKDLCRMAEPSDEYVITGCDVFFSGSCAGCAGKEVIENNRAPALN